MSQPPTLPPPPPPPPARGGDRTRSDSGYKTTVTILFVLIGLPPGLCSLYFTPPTIELLLQGNPQATAYAVLFGFPCLVGFVIFAGLLWWLIRTWRRAAP